MIGKLFLVLLIILIIFGLVVFQTDILDDKIKEIKNKLLTSIIPLNED